MPLKHIYIYIYIYIFFYFLEETIVYFILENLCCIMGKRKDGYSSNQTIASSFSFEALDKAKAARLHRKGIL